MARTLEQVVPGVHRFVDGLVNWYLVEEDGDLVLVDTGWPRSWTRLRSAVEALGRPLPAVRAVLLTHGHADHLGSAERARRETGAVVRISTDEVPRASGNRRGGSSFALVPKLVPHLWRPAAFRFVLHATLDGFLTPRWLREMEPFPGDGEVDVPGWPRAVATPGHTEGHTSYLFADRGLLFTGDALVTYDVLTGERGSRLMPNAVTADPVAARASLTALESLSAELLLPGHGEPVRTSPAEAVRRARAADRG